MNLTELIEDFEAILGWPYASPGSNDEKGIDCSGAFVRAFARQGETIAHGSNTIYRKHCSQAGTIVSEKELIPGMAVFKHRQDGGEPEKYREDGLGNFYHIGLVTGVEPLRIVHATTPAAKADDALGQWSHWGCLEKVNYEAAQAPIRAQVTAEVGATVNMRIRPDLSGALVCRVPVGETVTLLEENGNWRRIAWGSRTGWMLAAYLRQEGTLAALLADLRALIARYMEG